MDIKLKKATIADIPLLIEIEKSIPETKIYSPMLEESEWQHEIDNNIVYLIEENGVVAGNISYEKKNEDHLYISGLIIKPEFQGKGIAREVLNMILKKLENVKRINLVTHPDNIIALKLYQSLGFVVESRVENYYGDGEPRLALVMEKIKKEKPQILYHGSAHKKLEELKPQERSHRLEEGELLYATPDLSIASIFLVVGVHYGCGKFGDTPFAWIIANRDEFIRSDKGGYIYVLPSDSFELNQGRGLGNDEYASKEPVKPIKTIEYPSAIDAMIENGVQVYFIDQETHEKIKASKDHGYSIYCNLQSENQRRGENIKEFKSGI